MGTLTLALTTIKTQASLLSSLSQAILGLLERPTLVSPRDLSYVSNKPFHTLGLCLCGIIILNIGTQLWVGPICLCR